MKRYAITAALAAFSLCLGATALRADDTKTAPLKRAVTIKIPDSKGKFDFLEVDSVHHRLLAAHEKDETMDFIDLDTNKLITRLKLDGPPVHAVLYPKTDQYYISGSDEKKVFIVDAKTLKQTGEIELPGELDAIIYEPKNDRIYVTNDEGTHVFRIDPSTNKLDATIDVDGPPEYMVYSPDADRIFLNSKGANKVLVIDPSSSKVVESWSTEPAESPHGLGFDPANGRLYPAGKNGILGIIDSKTGKTIGSVKFGGEVDQNVFDPSTKRVYCASTDKMFVIQTTDEGGTLLGSVKTNATAKNVAVDPATHLIWTCYTDGKNAFAVGYKQQ